MTQPLVALTIGAEVYMGAALALALFLGLFWVLRGAPIGLGVEGEAAEAPGGGYRDRVVAGVVVGLLLIAAGAYVALSRGVLWSLPVFAVGFGLVLALIAVNRRYRHGSPALRRTIDFSNAALNAALLAGVLIVVNVLAFRYGGRPIDWTREGTYSLASLSVNQVKGLKKPVTFVAFFGRSERSGDLLQRVQQLLELYKRVNPTRVNVEMIDPYREVDRFAALAKLAPDLALVREQGGGVLIEYGEGETADRQVVRNTDLFVLPRGRKYEEDTSRFVTSFHGEDAITSALIRLTESKKLRVAFTTGHGETPAGTTDPRQPANGLWRARLNSTGSEVIDLNLAVQDVPPDLALLIVVAPKSPFQAEEVARIRAFLDRGGPALVLAGNSNPTGLEDLLRSYNIEVGPGAVIDPLVSRRNRLPVEALLVQVVPPTTHPILDSLAGQTVVLPTAAPLTLIGMKQGSPVNSRGVPSALLKTRREAWVETDAESLRARRPQLDPAKDQAGPVTVAAAVGDRPGPGDDSSGPKPRLVVIACGPFGDDSAIQIDPANLDLLMNAVGWLRGRPELLGITPNTHTAVTLNSDPTLRFKLFVVPSLTAVTVIIAAGLLTYLARRD